MAKKKKKSRFSHIGAQETCLMESEQYGVFQPKKFPWKVIGLHWFTVY